MKPEILLRLLHDTQHRVMLLEEALKEAHDELDRVREEHREVQERASG